MAGAEARRAAGSGRGPLRLGRRRAGGGADLVVASLGLLLGAGALAGLETVWPPVERMCTTALIACQLYALGFGYGAVWQGDAHSWLPGFASTTRFVHAHSGYLTLATEVGLPVTLLAVWQLAALSFRTIGDLARQRTTLALFAVGYVFWFGCHNLTESTLYRWNSDAWMILVALMTAALRSDAGAAPQERPRRADGASC